MATDLSVPSSAALAPWLVWWTSEGAARSCVSSSGDSLLFSPDLGDRLSYLEQAFRERISRIGTIWERGGNVIVPLDLRFYEPSMLFPLDEDGPMARFIDYDEMIGIAFWSSDVPVVRLWPGLVTDGRLRRVDLFDVECWSFQILT